MGTRIDKDSRGDLRKKDAKVMKNNKKKADIIKKKNYCIKKEI